MGLPRQVDIKDKVQNFQRSNVIRKKGMGHFLTASKFCVSSM